MKRYVYIEARDVSMPEDGGPMLSFAGVELTAVDDEAAYHMGNRLMREQEAIANESDFGHFDGAFLNDFVMEIA